MPIKSRVRLLRRAIKLVYESNPRLTLAILGIIFAQGMLPIVALYLMKQVIDTVTETLGVAREARDFSNVLLLIAAATVIALVSAAVDSLASYLNAAQSQAVSDNMLDTIHAKAVEVDLSYFENPDYHDTLHRAQEEAPQRPNRIVTGLAQLGQNTVVLFGMVGILISLHWGIVPLLSVLAVPALLIRLKFTNELYGWQKLRTLAERRAGYYHYLLTLQRWAKEVRLFGAGPLFRKRFRELRKQIRTERLSISRRRATADFATQAFAALPMFGVFLFVSYQTVQGILTLGGMVLYFQAFQRGQSALRAVTGSITALHEDTLFVSHLYEFLDLKPQLIGPEVPEPFPHPIRYGIEFRNVCFGYAQSPRKVIQDVSFTIGPGEVIALVGMNGSGKTTLVKLLCRLYDPTAGCILVDGTNLASFDTAEVRRNISVVFQDYAHYDLTAHDNIWLGNLDLPANDQRITLAAQNAGIDEKIRGLKSGYETVLGTWIEDGEELSIGQWQKVALARSFVRDAQIVILDEPTSALDPKAEAEVFEHFRRLAVGRSVILISHRLSTVKMSDRIYVIEDGRIAESGSHESLLQQKGRYSSLYEVQARSYQ